MRGLSAHFQSYDVRSRAPDWCLRKIGRIFESAHHREAVTRGGLPPKLCARIFRAFTKTLRKYDFLPNLVSLGPPILRTLRIPLPTVICSVVYPPNAHEMSSLWTDGYRTTIKRLSVFFVAIANPGHVCSQICQQTIQKPFCMVLYPSCHTILCHDNCAHFFYKRET